MRSCIRLIAVLSAGVLLALLLGPRALTGAAAVGAVAATGQTPTTASGAPAAQPVGDGQGDEVELMLFWGDGCPHCAAEHAWLEEAKAKYPDLVVTEYEVWYDEGNLALLAQTADDLGFEPSGVPVTVVGDRYWIGFSDTTAAEIEQAILDEGTGKPAPGAAQAAAAVDRTVDVPLVGQVTVNSSSLVFSTFVIGFVDGVNPCSLWVISVLLAMVVRTGSRRRVVAIGTAFLLVTAAMYAVYMVGIYSAINVMGHLGTVQVVVALVAGVFGAVSVKDYFAFKKGISFTIPDSAKPGIYRRMREATAQHNLLPALATTTVLAMGVSLLETPCTAGFPVLWTGLLEANGVGTAESALLFALYVVPFLVDELLVFTLAVITLRATRMQERHGRLLKLVAGTTMLALAVTVLVRPEAMNDPLGALVVFAAAFGVAGATHLLVGRLRPSRQRDDLVPRPPEPRRSVTPGRR